MTTTAYHVTGMSCEHCEKAIRAEVSQIPGVDDVQVSAATGQLSVTAQGALDDAAVIAAVDEAGYEAVRS